MHQQWRHSAARRGRTTSAHSLCSRGSASDSRGVRNRANRRFGASYQSYGGYPIANTPSPAGDPAAPARCLAGGPARASIAVNGAARSVEAAAPPLPLLGWRSVADELPAQWDETNDVCGEQWALRSSEALRFISRRRAEPEAAEVLARKPMPKPHAPQHMPKVSPIELPD